MPFIPLYLICCHLFLPTSAVVFTCLPLLLSVPVYCSSDFVCICLHLLSFVPVYLCFCTCLPLLLSLHVYLCCGLILSTSAVICTCLPLLSALPVYLFYNLFLSNFAVICSCLTLLPFFLFPVLLHHRSNSICVLFTFIIVATASVSCSPASS